MALKDRTVPAKRLKKEPGRLKNGHYTDLDLKYMNSLGNAALQRSSKSMKYTLWTVFVTIVFLIAWAYFAELDEITRGEGKIIPSRQIQTVQNLGSGIIEAIMVREGQKVAKGQALLKINDISQSSEFEENRIKFLELAAKAARLKAQANGTNFESIEYVEKQAPDIMRREEQLFQSNLEQYETTVSSLREKISQRESELAEARSHLEQTRESYRLIKQELDMTQPLVEKGIVSRVEFLKLQRDANKQYGEYRSAKLGIPRIQSTIQESKSNLQETVYQFKNKAKEELNEVQGEINIIQNKLAALQDKVQRTEIRSPVEGTVKRVMVNTIGGVIQSGEDLVEIVPTQDALVAEVKIKPQDIAYLHPDQEAVVKFTAYDFAIYGGLKGELEYISADTITDEEGKNFYIVRIKTDKPHLMHQGKKLDIIVGMTVSVDIITGKKSVLDYLLKPILKTKQNALTEK